MVDDTWSEYVSEAGTDPGALDVVADGMTETGTGVETAMDSIDTSAVSDNVAAAVDDAGYDAGQAAEWSSWADGTLADAAEWQDAAADHVTAAQEWLASGNVDGYQQEMASAETASDIADGVVGQANTELGIGAEYMDNSDASLATAADTATYDASAVDTSSYDTSSYDTAAVDTSSYDTSSVADVSSDV